MKRPLLYVGLIVLLMIVLAIISVTDMRIRAPQTETQETSENETLKTAPRFSVPEGFKGPTGPPSVKGPSGPPPSY